MTQARPRVGLLYNPTTLELLAYALTLVEHLSVMPDRLRFDFDGEPVNGRRFHRLHQGMAEVAHHAVGRSRGKHVTRHRRVRLVQRTPRPLHHAPR